MPHFPAHGWTQINTEVKSPKQPTPMYNLYKMLKSLFFQLAQILSNLSTLFRPQSSCSMFLFGLSKMSTLLLDFSNWSNEIFSLSTFSTLLYLCSVFLVLSRVDLDFSLRSVLFREGSKKSMLFRDGSIRSTLSLQACLWDGDFSTVWTNFLRCLRYSGKSSKSQCFPPLSHKGSYFSLQSSHSCLPWDQSTTSSAVPYISPKELSTPVTKKCMQSEFEKMKPRNALVDVKILCPKFIHKLRINCKVIPVKFPSIPCA